MRRWLPRACERPRQLEQENAKLKKLIAERDLAIDVMKELGASSRGRQAAMRRRGRFLGTCSGMGQEFLSRAILRWLAHEKIETALIDPGKPGPKKAGKSGARGPDRRTSKGIWPRPHRRNGSITV